MTQVIEIDAARAGDVGRNAVESDSFDILAARFDAGQLSGDEYLRLVELEWSESEPAPTDPVTADSGRTPFSARTGSA